MKRGMSISIFLLTVSLILVGPGIVAWTAEDTQTKSTPVTLNNKIFIGEMGKVGATKGDKDEFIFKAGQFRSSACDSYGFSSAPYKITVNGNIISFEAQTKSPTDGTMKWKGTVKGNAIEGTATWIKDGKKPIEHWFKGASKS